MMAIDPMTVNDAMVNLYCGWIGVIGVVSREPACKGKSHD